MPGGRAGVVLNQVAEALVERNSKGDFRVTRTGADRRAKDIASAVYVPVSERRADTGGRETVVIDGGQASYSATRLPSQGGGWLLRRRTGRLRNRGGVDRWSGSSALEFREELTLLRYRAGSPTWGPSSLRDVNGRTSGC